MPYGNKPKPKPGIAGPPFGADGTRPSGPKPPQNFPSKPRPKPSGPATGQARPLTNMTEMLPARSAGTEKPAGTASTTKKVKSFMKKYGQA